MKVSEKLIQKMYDGLWKEKTYCGVIGGVGTGVISLSDDKRLIRWSHFGSSAERYTKKDLRFILEVIFDDCEDFSEAVWSDYHIAYIPTEKGYVGFDYSGQHPNALGV